MMTVRAVEKGTGRVRTGRIGGGSGSGGVSPAFQADFTGLTSLPSWMLLSRASNAMVTDSTGKLTYAPNNLLTNSNTFTSWTANNVSLVAGQSDSDGGNNATFLKTASGDAYHYISLSYGLNPTKYIFSIEAEANGYSFLQLGTAGDDTRQATFDLATGIVGIAGSNTVATITSLGSGRHRCSIAVTTTDFTWILTIGVCNTSTWSNFNADGVSGVNIYKASIAAVTYETSPRSADQVITGGSAYYGPRFDHAWNGSAWVATGLMDEEQRTNYAHPSIPGSGWQGGGGTFTANFGVAPDGTTTATQIVCGDGTLADRSVYLDLTAASCPAVSTGAAWVKGTAGEKVYLILYSTDYSNRVLITFDGTWQRIPTAPSSSAPQYVFFDTSTTGGADPTNGLPAVTFLAWHVDVQGGSSITSTIPTATAAVTRSADIAQLTGAAQAAMQAVASTVLVEVDQVQGDYAQLMGADGSTVIARDGANTGRLYTEAVSPSLNVLVDTTATFRAGMSKDGSGVSFVSNGGTVSTSSNPGTDFTGRNFRVGSRVDGYFINAHLRSIAIDTTRYSNADLQAKSVVGAAF